MLLTSWYLGQIVKHKAREAAAAVAAAVQRQQRSLGLADPLSGLHAAPGYHERESLLENSANNFT